MPDHFTLHVHIFEKLFYAHAPKILGIHKGYKQEWLRGEGSNAGRGHVHEGLRLEDGSGWVGIGHTLAEDGNKNEQVLDLLNW